MGTKGTWKRPSAISDAEAQARWDAVFGQPQRYFDRFGREVEETTVGWRIVGPLPTPSASE